MYNRSVGIYIYAIKVNSCPEKESDEVRGKEKA